MTWRPLLIRNKAKAAKKKYEAALRFEFFGIPE